MKKIEDENFNKIFEKNKFCDIKDWSTVEVRVATGGSILLAIISIVLNIFIGADEYISVAIQILYDVGIAMIGFLGFIVTGLAILTGSISSKVVKILKDNESYEDMKEILLSFYFLSFLSGILIIVIFALYFMSKFSIDSVIVANVFITLIMAYFIIYVIFYAVGLIGNCLSIFDIVSEIEIQKDSEDKSIKEKYDSYRIIALEYLILMSSDGRKLDLYDKKINELINKDDTINDEQKFKLLLMQKKHFGK